MNLSYDFVSHHSPKTVTPTDHELESLKQEAKMTFPFSKLAALDIFQSWLTWILVNTNDTVCNMQTLS